MQFRPLSGIALWRVNGSIQYLQIAVNVSALFFRTWSAAYPWLHACVCCMSGGALRPYTMLREASPLVKTAQFELLKVFSHLENIL